tara:strand:- start:1566 stop:1946 length:381 start_codon:yes stop_codon:yes gene_type:complete
VGRLEVRQVKVSGAGSAGSATGSAVEPVPFSYLHAIYFDFTSAPSTMDTTVKTPGNSDLPSVTVLTLTNVNSDAWYYPRRQIEGNTGAQVTGAYDKYFLSGSISIDIAQADAVTDEVVAWVVIEIP